MNKALETWREKLAHYQSEEALAVDPEQKFQLKKRILEAKAKIAELEAATGSQPTASPTTVSADISRIIKYAPAKLIGREEETALLDKTLAQMKRGTKTRPRVLTFVALGGEGKTSLVAKWAADVALKSNPGCESIFAWSFYSQGTREQIAVSSDLFLAEALKFFGDDEDKLFADSNAGAAEKGKRLAALVGQRRNVLILDGLEPLQYPVETLDGQLKDDGIYMLLSGLATRSEGLCVVTTRYAIPDLKGFQGKTVRELPLLRLSPKAGVDLLQSIGVQGSLHQPEPNVENPEGLNEFERLVEDVDGHALTLQIVGTYLVRAYNGDIRQRDRIEFEKAQRRVPGNQSFHSSHAFRAIGAYESWLAGDSDESRRELAVLRLLGLFDRPATADCVAALLQPPTIAGLTDPLVGIADDDWEFTLTTLEDARLISVNRDGLSGKLAALDAHPLLREYFAGQVSGKALVAGSASEVDPTLPAAIAAPLTEAWRAAHRRLYEHLCASTPDKPDATLEDLQPLYQAVAHGCQAGLQQEVRAKVYRDRILRGKEAYSTKKLGAFGSNLGAVACFFEIPWSSVSPALTEADQAWLLNEAAFTLRALGRLTEALEPMQAALEMGVKQENWQAAAIRASNLSELELTLGEVAEAVVDASNSVTYADRSGDGFWKMGTRTTHADALHQAGRRAEAEALFREAEQMQAERQPAYPLLYSVRGFRYCELLLTEAERAAWQCSLHAPREESGAAKNATIRQDVNSHSEAFAPHRLPHAEREDYIQSCRAVTDRAAQIQTRRTGLATYSLLDIALDHLTLGRAALYAAVLSSDSASPSSFELATSHLDSAVSGLRRAGTTHHIPRGLLTRAWQRSLSGARTGLESAQSDLDEAWEIAARGPMPLFLADIHLHRARLFGFGDGFLPLSVSPPLPISPSPAPPISPSQYPWESPRHDLAEARRLIEKHGYLRRLPELEDAEAALLPSTNEPTP